VRDALWEARETADAQKAAEDRGVPDGDTDADADTDADTEHGRAGSAP
jgi:hypothetical protein